MNARKRPVPSRTIPNRSSETAGGVTRHLAKKQCADVALKKLEGEFDKYKKESETVAFTATASERKMRKKLSETMQLLEQEQQKLKEFKELASSNQAENDEQIKEKNTQIDKFHAEVLSTHKELEASIHKLQEKDSCITRMENTQEYLWKVIYGTIPYITGAEYEIAKGRQDILYLNEKISVLLSMSGNLKKDATDASAANEKLRLKIAELENRESIHLSTIESLKNSISDAKSMLGSTQGSLTYATEREKAKDLLILEGERARRKLLVQIEEMKGNIRVYCRVRPLLGDKVRAQISLTDDIDHRTIELVQLKTNATSTGTVEKPINFKYDYVYGPNAAQEQVFQNIEPLIESAVDGYRVCILAYGQTGSGKTYTMEGTFENQGVIPRSFSKICEAANILSERFEWSFEFSCTYVEIYNDVIRDLLLDSEDYRRAIIDRNEVKHEIRHDGKNDTTITGVSVVSIRNYGDFNQILQTAHKNRTTARTKLNERSSRSHSVFTIKIEGFNPKLQQRTHGILCLIDLAGSERVSESGALGLQLKEAVNINRSLSHLGDVIAALGQREKRESLTDNCTDSHHIPFRNCKLTYLLQNYLGGEGSKVLLLVNISSAEEHVSETLSSLRFASKVNSTSIGTAKKKMSTA